MWFLFGFITILTFSIYFGWQRLLAGWKGKRQTTHGIDWEYRVDNGKYGPVAYRIGIAGPSGLAFTLKPEKWYDRLFKSIGLVSEDEVGEDEFDRLIYIIADNPHIADTLSLDTGLREHLLQLFQQMPGNKSRIRRLRCLSGRLWIEYAVSSGFSTDQIPDIAEQLLPRLQAIATTLDSKLLQDTIRGHKDAFVMRAAILLGISTGLAINAFVQFFRYVFYHVPFTVDVMPMLQQSLVVGGIVAALLIVSAFVLLGRNARTHLVLIELILVGLPGAMGSTYFVLDDVNREFDTTLANTFHVSVKDLHVSRGKHTSYHVTVNDWNNTAADRKFQVAGRFFRTLTRGDTLQIDEHPGRLGFRWVSDVRRMKASGHAKRPGHEAARSEQSRLEQYLQHQAE